MRDQVTKTGFPLILLIIWNTKSSLQVVPDTETGDYHTFINSLSSRYGTEIYFEEFRSDSEKPLFILINHYKGIIYTSEGYNWKALGTFIQEQMDVHK